MRRILQTPGITFVLFVAWKLILLLLTCQPVPFADCFFYDGSVVNYLLHGEYCNPAVAPALPISGTEVFSAYPPLYQGLLLLWMRGFGTSALSAMWLHALLLSGFVAVTYSTLKMLRAPAAALNWAGLFCFGISFHDRPDSLAYLLAALAVWACVRARCQSSLVWFWASAGLLVLTFCASLQIGGIYMVTLALLAIGGALLNRTRVPWLPCLACLTVIFALILFVIVCCPRCWAGFQEHLKVTPSVNGLRVPAAFELLKVGRAVAGISLVSLALGWLLIAGKLKSMLPNSHSMLLAVSAVLSALLLAGSSLVLFFADMIRFSTYLQPLIVGAFFTACAGEVFPAVQRRLLRGLFVVALLVVSVRSIGISTWGVLCAWDVSHARATALVRQELDGTPDGSTVIFSSAYLYDAARRTNVAWVHCEWVSTKATPGGYGGGVARLRPVKFILTEFDYYSRVAPMLNHLKNGPKPPDFVVRHTTGIPTPDSSPVLQKPFKQLSWAPVIVDCVWPPVGPAK